MSFLGPRPSIGNLGDVQGASAWTTFSGNCRRAKPSLDRSFSDLNLDTLVAYDPNSESCNQNYTVSVDILLRKYAEVIGMKRNLINHQGPGLTNQVERR